MKYIISLVTMAVKNPIIFMTKIFTYIRYGKRTSNRIVSKKVNNVSFEYDFRQDSAIARMYHNIYEIYTVKVMKRFLKKGDVFIDVGANIGYLTMIAAGLVGTEGAVHSFEPVPRHYDRLHKMALNNPLFKIVTNNIAGSDREGSVSLQISNLPNIGWNTCVPDFMPPQVVKESITVKTCRLDRYIQENNIRKVNLIKIDTEGYELPILKGLKDYMSSVIDKPTIICEIAPGAYSLLGQTLEDLKELMRSYGYSAYDVKNNRIAIDILSLKKTTDVVFKSIGMIS